MQVIDQLNTVNAISPLSKDVIDQAIELFEVFGVEDYKEEIDTLVDKSFAGTNLTADILGIIIEQISIISINVGIQFSIETSIREKIDILEAIYILPTLEKDLKDEILNSLERVDNRADLETMIEEYLKTDISALDYVIDSISDELISSIVSMLKSDTDDDVLDIFNMNVLKKALISVLELNADSISLLERLTVHGIDTPLEDNLKIINRDMLNNATISITLTRVVLLLFTSVESRDNVMDMFEKHVVPLLDTSMLERIRVALTVKILEVNDAKDI